MSVFVRTILILALISPLSAMANDSTATLKGGGLELTQSPDISMESEDLYISPQTVRVNYLFKNNGSKDIETLVAFPLPKVDSQALYERDVMIDHSNPNNFVDFKIKVNGQPLSPQGKLRAFVGKTEVTQELLQLKLPLCPFDPTLNDKLRALPLSTQKRLAAKKIMVASEDGAEAAPLWTFDATYYWKQKFPAGQTLRVAHEYKPVVGHSFLMLSTDLVQNRKRYCIDAGTEKGIRSKLKTEESYLNRREIEYILKTGANWKGPIKNFKLTVDKENPNAIVSLCEPNIKKVGPTTFQVSYKNYTPTKDLAILILQPQ